ncbi:MAG: sodium:calcium antiporter [Hyphomicrobiaceae bacterium]|nr:MAG: sodium:calcium antiporter [Hyphomicrobiaceae bacterium]
MNVLSLLLGVMCAAGGGELFVRGTVGLAKTLRISPGVVAATVAAFATSSPELTVSITAALHGTPRIALGDALGSNVVNVALILGSALLIGVLHAPRATIKRDFPTALVVPVATAVLFIDGELSQMDGLLLLAIFVVWLVTVIREARRERSAIEEVLGAYPPGRALVEGTIGLGLLIAAGRLIVAGASGIASAYSVSDFVIGATVVAVGTSVPELATTIISRLRGHDEVGLGTILGSNIFNGLFIVGLASSITPIRASFAEVAPALILGLAAIALSYPPRSGIIDRHRGLMLLAVYAVYFTAVLQGLSE